MSQVQVRRFSQLIQTHAAAEGLRPSVVAGLIDVESGGDPDATSPDNGPGLGHALGLMQVLEGHFASGENGHDPETNLRVGCRILGQKLDAFSGRLASGLAAYFGAVDANGNPTDGTDLTGTSGKRYVALVTGAAAQYQDLDQTTAGELSSGSGPSGGSTDAAKSPPADADFLAYAPSTGTWREAAINLKGIADRALASGRALVVLAHKHAADVDGAWGGQ